jgi:hypothetical protein
MDDELDQLLNKRMTPPKPRADLANQIVQRALEGEAKSAGTIGWLNQLASAFRQTFIIPQPGIAFAVILLIGVWAGMNLDLDTLFSAYTAEDLAYTFIVDEGLNKGEWL